jgi:two-component system chemotaxis response regulator CheB
MSPRGADTRILICEDSPSYAIALSRFLRRDGDLEVVGTCSSGEELLESLPRLGPDLVVLDLELPGMGGQRAIEEIMRSPHPLPILVLSGHVGRGSERAAAALAAGALEALPKTHVRLDDPAGPAAVALRHRVRRLSRARVGRKPGRAPAARLERGPQAASVVAICASTGGPGALATILAELPADFPLPVLIVQHMTEGFIGGLVRWIAPRVPLPVRVASDGMALAPGIWFAPDDAHLLLQPSMRLAVDRETLAGALRPSADILLTSVAAAAGAGGIGVVLTGMGRDGGRGVAAMSRAGGWVIAQDEETSVVFGMPRTAIEQGANVVLPLSEIAGALRKLRVAEVVA